MNVRIGANPIGWTNDDLQEVGGNTSLETCLAEAKEAGVEGMELGHKFPREPDALRATLDWTVHAARPELGRQTVEVASERESDDLRTGS